MLRILRTHLVGSSLKLDQGAVILLLPVLELGRRACESILEPFIGGGSYFATCKTLLVNLGVVPLSTKADPSLNVTSYPQADR